MFGIYLRMLKDKWKSLLIYTVTALALAEMYVAMYPALKDALGSMEELLKAFPEGFMEAFGFDASELTFQTVESLLATELFNLMWPIVAIIMVVSLATYSIVGDIEKGTIEIVLSQPVSRLRIFTARVMGSLTILTAFAFGSVYGIIPLTMMHNIEYNLEGYWYMSLLGTMFVFGVYGIAILFSALFSEKGRATFGVVGVLLAMYAVSIASGLRESIENLQYTSFFHYLNPADALIREEFVEYSVYMFLGVGIVGMTLALIRFMTRDITT